VKDENLQEAFQNLADYLVGRVPHDWTNLAVEIEFIADDVVKLSGQYADETGETRALSFDYEVVAIADNIRQSLDELQSGGIQGLRLSLQADGTLSTEFEYTDDV